MVWGRRILTAIVRGAVIAILSIAAAFSYIAAMRNPAVAYDPNMFATGLAGLFGAA